MDALNSDPWCTLSRLQHNLFVVVPVLLFAHAERVVSHNSIAELQINPNEKPIIGKSGTIFMYLFIRRYCLSIVVWLHCWADTNVTLAFEDAQVIQPFSREETEDTDNTYGTDDTDNTDDKVNTADTMIQMLQMIQE